MGGGSGYARAVHKSSSYSDWGSSTIASSKLNKTTLASSMYPNGKIITSNTKNPIIIMLDVTGSNINFAKLVYDKLPMFYGEIDARGYFKDFDISICAVGDAYCDEYPLQIGDFAKGIEIDSIIENIVLEGGGGAPCRESYELGGYYLLNNVKFDKDASPIIFFIGDEMSYDYVDVSQAKKIGIPLQNESYNPFPDLNKKYNNRVYMMLNKYCGSNFEDEITESWRKILSPQHVIKIMPEEKAIVDLMLGAIAIEAKNDLEVYALDMKNRGQTQERINGVTSSLKGLSESMALQRIENVSVDLDSQAKLVRRPGSGRRL